LCAAEYPLSDALAGVPPALIVVDAAAATELPVEPGTGLEPAVEAGAEVTPDGVATEAAREAAEETTAAAEHEIDLAPDEEAVAKEGEETTAEAAYETFDASAFAGLGKELAAGDGKEPPPGVPRRRTRRKVKEKNPVKEVIGIALGGFLGLLIGYYVLAWTGFASGLPDLKLPFLPSQQAPKPEGENKSDAESDNAESRVPDQRGPFDRFAV
jgi:hypothetical protein